MTSKTYLIIGIVSLLGIIFIVGCVQKEKQDTTPTNNEFSEIKECIMGINVDYTSNTNVQDLSGVESVFSEFVMDLKEKKQEIFGHNPEFYRFKSATIHGTYQGKKYWEVTTEWYGTDPENSFAYNKWMPEEVFDVSENGEVVRLLGCI